jgi:hypothetical protein
MVGVTGRSIASSVAESTVNQSDQPSLRKKRQMRWEPENARRLLQLRTQTLNDELRSTFDGLMVRGRRFGEHGLADAQFLARILDSDGYRDQRSDWPPGLIQRVFK